MTVSTKSRPHDSGRRCGRMQVWLGERKPSGLAISDWVITEFPAALSMKLWNGQIEAIYPARRERCSWGSRNLGGILDYANRLSVCQLELRDPSTAKDRCSS